MSVENRINPAASIYPIARINVGDAFGVTFPFLNFDEHLVVSLKSADTTVRELILDVDYRVELLDGLNDVWGRVVSLKLFEDLQSIAIVRVLKNDQTQTFNSQMFVGTNVEHGLDKLTMLSQDSDFRHHTIHTADNDATPAKELQLPGREQRANSYMAFDKDGNLELRIKVDPALLSTISAGKNVTIVNGQISAVDTTYEPGSNVFFQGQKINAIDTTYEAGSYVEIKGGVISVDLSSLDARITRFISQEGKAISNDGRYIIEDTLAFNGKHFLLFTRTDKTKGYCFSSTDGKSWVAGEMFPWTMKRLISADDAFMGLEHDTNKLAISAAPKAGEKPGVSWSKTPLKDVFLYRNSAQAQPWADLAYGDGVVVVINAGSIFPITENLGGSKIALGTYDGKYWNFEYLPFPGLIEEGSPWHCITYGSDRFVMLRRNSDVAAYSSDKGVTWRFTKLPSVEPWTSIAYGKGHGFVAAAETCLAFSKDGIAWTRVETPIVKDVFKVQYTLGVFFAFGKGKSQMYSYNGTSWGLFEFNIDLGEFASTVGLDSFWLFASQVPRNITPVVVYDDTHLTGGDNVTIDQYGRIHSSTPLATSKTIGGIRARSSEVEGMSACEIVALKDGVAFAEVPKLSDTYRTQPGLVALPMPGEGVLGVGDNSELLLGIGAGLEGKNGKLQVKPADDTIVVTDKGLKGNYEGGSGIEINGRVISSTSGGGISKKVYRGPIGMQWWTKISSNTWMFAFTCQGVDPADTVIARHDIRWPLPYDRSARIHCWERIQEVRADRGVINFYYFASYDNAIQAYAAPASDVDFEIIVLK